MNADGTYSFGLGLQENVRARLLSKYGVGLEVIAGSQQNLLWTIGEGLANPSLQLLAFASAGVALPLGGYIPVIPNLSWYYESNPPSTGTAALSAAAPAVAAPDDLGGPTPFAASSTTPVSKGTSIVAPTGSAYPMAYLPASATDALLALPKGPIASLLDAPATLEWHQLRSFSASQLSSGVLEWSKNNTFVGLNDGTYTNVPLVGLGLPGSSPATASFTASGGVIANLVVQGARSLSLSGWISDGVLTLQAASDPGLQNGDVVTGPGVTALALPAPLLISGLATAYDATSQSVSYRLNQSVSLGGSSNLQPIAVETTQGQYLALPEPKSGRYVFGLDVFQAQSGNPAPPVVSSAGSVLDGLPLFSLQTATGSNNSPLSSANIQRIQAQLPISSLNQGGAYPKADGSAPAANDYSVYSYSQVPIELLSNDGSGNPITPLNPGVTATVKLSAGTIVAVTLDQPLYFALPSSAYAGLPYTLVVDVEQALGNANLVNPSLIVTPQQQALNNFTDQDSFSANASIHNAGVFLSSGVSDQLPLLASYGRLPVQNRVSYLDGDTVVYLNNTGGSSASWQAVSSSQLTLEAIYIAPGNTHFTAANNPTAITDTASNTTYVFWVEASDPVIPLTGSDGEANYQAFMNALYGHQRINYSYATTSQAGTNTKWNYVNVKDLYAPADTLITDLRSFVVQVDGVQRSLLVWTELPISALKNAEANPKELITRQLAVIKVGLINPNAASTLSGYTWNALFNDASGQSTIATIPWSEDRGSGLSIADLSAATLQVQVEPVARFSGIINGTTLTVSPLSAGSLAVGDLILGAGIKASTTVTAITRAATASRAGSYQVSTSQTVSSSTNLAAVPLTGDTASNAFAFAGSFSGSGNTTLTLSSGASALQVGDQLFGVGIEPGTFITGVISVNAATGAGSFQVNRGPASTSGSAALLALPAGSPSPETSQTLTTPVLSWGEAVRTPYNAAVLDSAPLLFVPMAGLQAGINSLNLGTASGNTETFVSSTGLNTSFAGALPKSSASAVQNVQGLGVLATGLGSNNSATLEVLRNTPQTPVIAADSPVAIFNGAINGTSLTIASVSQGSLAVGELLVGEGIPAGTTIAALPGSPNADQSGVYTLAYAPGADSSTVLAATTLRTLPETGGLPLVSFAGSFSGAGGANGYTTLAITDLSDPLQVGDQVLGLGLPGGSTITQVLSLDLNSGNAQVIVSQGPSSSGGSYGLASSTGGSSSPYTIAFWTQLEPGSNPAGAGLVALGQPTGRALPDRPGELPKGWLLSSSFGVEKLSWQDALNLSLETSLDGNSASDLYGWRWALVADGTNTTAMDGSGGNNLYRNALLLNNLLVGDTIEGVNSFLAAYGLSSSDLTGFDGTPADQIASSPTTQFQFTTGFSPNQALGGEAVPSTSLNGVAIATSTAEMNGGIVLAAQANANANLNAMFQNLWNFEQTYGQTKVNFSLNPLTQPVPPVPSKPATPPSTNRIEQYGGYQLQFVLQPGPAVSVNATGQIAFDVAPGVTLVSADGVDYRGNGWHYVAASFLPDYFTSSASGTTLELPRNVGTANLYVDGKVVATQANVINPYAASNFNDAAQLLSDNAGGAIDLLAIYGQALTTSQPPAFASDWPLPTSTDALALLQEVGFVVASKTPNPGQQPGAISNHYLAHTVDPNNAAKSTFTSALLPDAKGGLSWSQASTLNPQVAITPTTASASSPSLQSDLLIPIATTAWGQQGWFTNAAPTTPGVANPAVVANPAGKTLKGITVTLTPTGGSTAVIRQLSTKEVLLGTTALAALQPKAQDANFAYTFLSNAPALNLLISREPSGTGDSNNLDPTVPYSASVKLQFADGTSLSNTSSGQSAGTVVPLGFSTSLAATLKTDSIANSKALATADVLEAAPLQLKYIDSGVQLSSQNAPSDPTPASSFGNSQVYGSFANTDGSTNSGWLAISQPRSSNAVSDPAGRVWINFAGAFTSSTDSQGNQLSSAVSDPAQAPITWLNALAASNFSPNRPNLPLLHSALYQSSLGGLLIKADPSAGWGQNFGNNMLVADVNNDGTDDLVIAAPQANGGGAVVIIDGSWIKNNLTSSTGQTILDLSNPGNFGPSITVLRPGNAKTLTDITTAAGFGTAIAFQGGSSGTPGTLFVGAPNYLRTLDASNAQGSTQAIGALYAYSTSAYAGSWGSANPTPLSNPILGSSGTVTIPQAGNSSSTSWWGAQLGTAVAISSSGDLAVSAPGVVGAMVYTGTEAVTDAFNTFDLNAKPELSSGLLYKLQLGGSPDATQGVDSPLYTVISGLAADNLSSQQKNFLTTFKNKMVTQVAGATMQNNQAIQAAAIGAVMVLNSDTNVASLGNKVLTATSVNSLKGRTYYGANPFNTLGDSGFGSSLSFADLTNSNSDQLIVGASQSGGGGIVYMLDPSASYSDNSLGLNQYMAVLAATNVVTAAEATDYLGSGLVNLGDVNSDGLDDLLIQAYNAASSAGNGYLLFGGDQLSTSNADQGLIALAPGSIGSIQYANGSNSSLAILSELGSAGGLTGQGTYGPGDYNADGLNDIALGSGPNAKGYLTWGHSYLASISDLQLSKLASDTGFLLDGLATTTQGSLRSIGDFNGDGYGDFISINPGTILTTVRIELGANTQEILAEAPYSYYTFSVANGTQVLPGGDINGDGMADIALFLDQNLSTATDGNQGAGSTTGILYGRASTELPLGSGFGFIAPVDPSTSAPLTPPPGLLLEGSDGLKGLTDATPSVIAVGNTLYAAVKGANDNTLWFNQSRDGGSSWDDWSELSTISNAFSTSTGPSLLNFGGRIYLSFLNSAGTLSLSSWDPGSNNPLAWTAPVALSDGAGSAEFASATGPQLVDRGDSLGVLWVKNGSVYAATNTNPSSSSSTWSTPLQLQQIADGAGAPIAASDAPSFTWLGSSAVLAVNEGGSINVYAALGGGSSLRLASSFSAPVGGPSIVSAPVLASTDTGLVLTYTNSDGSISLNRLELLSANGTPLPGVLLAADGSLDVSQAALQWQTTSLDATNSGISSSLASTPVSLDGNLLLANVRNASNPTNEIWLNAIANASDPASTTWLNTTVQLRDGSGGWSISQQAGSNAPTAVSASWAVLSGGQSPRPPALTEANGVLYAAVQGTDNRIYWNSSSNGGQSWSAWQLLPSSMSTNQAPALAMVNGTLYLAFLGNGNPQINITSLSGSNTWSSQYQIPNQTAKSICLVNENNNLALYYQGSNDNLYRTSTANPSSSSSWQVNAIQYNNGSAPQTASGQLAVATLAGSTYVAYEGGTSSNQSNTIYLTSSANQGTASSWSLISGIPQASSSSHSGVGLASFGDSLLLSYADQVKGAPVLALQQGSVSNNNWSGIPYANLSSPGATAAPGASLITPNGSSQVLVASINGNSNPARAISTTLAAAQPLDQLLTPGQTGSSLTSVGDLNNDGFADLLVSANNVVANTGAGQQLSTGLRLISGAATSAELQAINNPTASVQTVQAAPFFGLNSAVAVASLSGPAKLTLTATSAVSGQPSTLHTDLDVGRFLATAADPDSLQQLFNPDTAPLAGQAGLGLGFGSLGLNSTGSFGDLNGDGYLDYHNSSPTSLYGGDGLAWLIWSLRSAGDVNGNGTDDVLLGLVPPETVLNQQPQWIQSVLLDGLLFDVDTSTHSFGLDQLKVAISPNGLAQLAARSDTSTDDQISQMLQYWFDPILGFKPPTGNQSVQLSKSSAAAVDVAGFSLARTMATAYSSNGQTYLVSSGRDTTPIQITSFGADGNQVNWSLDLPGATISKASSKAMVSPSGAVIYGDRLYILASTAPAISSAWQDGSTIPADYNGTMWLLSISLQDLNPESATDPNQKWADKWTVTTLPAVTKLAPALVNEGDRLGIYFVANNNDMTLLRIYSQQPLAPEPVWVGGSGATVQWTDNGQLADIKLSKGADSEPPNAFNLAATRFQGRTVLGFTQAQIKSAGIDYTYLLEQQGSDPDSPWLQSSPLTKDDQGNNLNPYGIYLGANASQLGLALADSIYNAITTSSGSTIYTLKGYESNLRLYSGVTAAPSPTVKTTSTEDGIVLGLSAIGSHLTLQTQAKSSSQFKLQTYNSVWAAAQQSSLAGYSLDGASDINGDGFGDLLISDPSDPSKSVNNQYALFGGDFLNIATEVGTDGNDVIVGTSLADVIYTIQGADQVSSNGGADVIYTAAGDDLISIVDNAFIRIDAGSGFDLLALEGKANQSYDFRLNVPTPQYFAGTKLRDIELISSRDFGANTLRFDAAAVNAINPDRILFLTPDAVDTVVLTTDFQRNSAFDTTYGGSLWNAYAAGTATTPADSSPTLVYVLNPNGASDSDWLNAHVLCLDTPAEPVAASLQASATLGATRSASETPGAAVTRNQDNPTTFGNGLKVMAYTTTSGSTSARFSIHRDDASKFQVVTYTTSSENASAKAGVDYSVAAGQIVFKSGETDKEILIALNPDSLEDSRKSSLSLAVVERPFSDQKEVHVLIQSLKDALSGRRSVLSGVSLDVNELAATAQLRLRADTNTGEQGQLKLLISTRTSADTLVVAKSQEVSINDFNPDLGIIKPGDNLLNLDNDGRPNQQVKINLQLNLHATPRDSLVSLLGADLTWQSSVQLLNGNQVQFSQDAPLTIWRADSAPGRVTFGLQAGEKSLTLITDAQGGSAGSLNASNANSAEGWQTTEARAIGSRSITDAQNLSGPDWTPTASRDGVSLALLNLAVDGNQVTASFSGGVSGVFWQATGNAPTVVPAPAAVEVQRLAGYANSLGFYSVDSITGMVAGLNPGDNGYLQAALARSQGEGLLLDSKTLPPFGGSATFNALPLDTRERYGVLLLQNGDPAVIFSSFAAANPFGATQMVSLSNSSNNLVFGIEDLSVAGGYSDSDFNDLIVRIQNVAVQLF